MQLFKQISMALVLVGLTGSNAYAESMPELFEKIGAGKASDVKKLLRGGYPATVTYEGQNALHYICSMDIIGDIDIIYPVHMAKWVLDSIKDKGTRKIFLDAKDNDGDGALHLAVQLYTEIKGEKEELEEDDALDKYPMLWVQHKRLKPFVQLLQ